MQAGKQVRLSRKARRCASDYALERMDRIDPALAELRLVPDRSNAFNRVERLRAARGFRNIVVEQGQIELYMQRFLEELT